MELLYILLILVALVLAWHGVTMFLAWRSRLRLKLEPVPPGPDPDRTPNPELGKVRVRPRAEPVLHKEQPALHKEHHEALHGQLNESTAVSVAVDVQPSVLPVRVEALPVEPTTDVMPPVSFDEAAMPARVDETEPAVETVARTSPAAVMTLPLEVEQHDLFADEPIAPPPDRRHTPSRAQALYETPTVEPVRPVAKEPAEKPVLNIEQVIALHVVARAHPFNGEDLLRSVLSYGLRFGDMSIFHRHEQPSGQGRVLFSMAKAVEPGTFALETMTGEEIPGVSFFLGLPGVSSITAYDIMVDTARRLAIELQGDVLDENQQPLTRQLVDHYRERVQEFERRRLMNRPDGR